MVFGTCGARGRLPIHFYKAVTCAWLLMDDCTNCAICKGSNRGSFAAALVLCLS
jgi:hypothetical protein